MDFLFGNRKEKGDKQEKGPADASVNSTIPDSNGSENIVITVDPALFATQKPISSNPIDITMTTSFKFTRIMANSVRDGEGFMHNRLLKNQFLGMAHLAFDNHYGFVLNASQIFLLIIHQIALHVNYNAEQLRSQFVTHDGKKELSIDIPAVPTEEDWKGIIENFQSQIQANTLPDTHSLLTMRDFVGANDSEKVAGDIGLMDICQEFFDYKCYTRCGIPYFVLEGPVEDWQLLREKAEQALDRKTLPEFSRQWKESLLPILDKLLLARRGEEVDLHFWNDFFKIGAKNGSGGYTYISGWVNTFFPITNEKRRPQNQYAHSNFRKFNGGGCDVQNFPTGSSSAPVIWMRLGQRIPLRFAGGFVGGKLVHGNCIRPEIGWWLGEIDEEASKKKKHPWEE